MGTDSPDDGRMEAIIRAGELKTWLNCISAVVDEYKHNVTGTSFHAAAMDPGNVSMVSTTLGANAFESFEAGKLTFGMDISKLSDTLAKAGKDDLVELRLTEKNRLRVKYGRIQRDVATIDPDAIRSEPDIPDIDYAGTVELQTSHLKEGVWVCDMVSDQTDVRFDAAEETITFSASGDTDNSKAELDSSEFESGEIEETAESMYSLDYLQGIVSALPGETSEFSIGEEFPLKLTSSISDSSRVQYNIAPRREKN